MCKQPEGGGEQNGKTGRNSSKCNDEMIVVDCVAAVFIMEIDDYVAVCLVQRVIRKRRIIGFL